MVKSIQSKFSFHLKNFVKSLLCKFPNKERIFRRFLFRGEDMSIPSDAYNVYLKHYAAVCEYLTMNGKTVLELGPGNSLNSIIFFYFVGAEKIYVVDSGNYISYNMSTYYSFIDYLIENAAEHMINDISSLKECRNVNELLKRTNAAYLTHGIYSLSWFAEESIDFIFSNNVIEHIHKDELIPEIQELYRISRGIVSHDVAYTDNLSRNVYSLKIHEKIWESDLFKSSGFYTNRFCHNLVVDIFTDAGFGVLDIKKREYKKNTFKIPLNKDFSERQDLNIVGAHIVFNKN